MIRRGEIRRPKSSIGIAANLAAGVFQSLNWWCSSSLFDFFFLIVEIFGEEKTCHGDFILHKGGGGGRGCCGQC